jgi:hypothetical protein
MLTANGTRACDKEVGGSNRWHICGRVAICSVPSRSVIGYWLDYCSYHRLGGDKECDLAIERAALDRECPDCGITNCHTNH